MQMISKIAVPSSVHYGKLIRDFITNKLEKEIWNWSSLGHVAGPILSYRLQNVACPFLEIKYRQLLF